MSGAAASPGATAFESGSELRERHAQLLEALDDFIGPDGTESAEVGALSRLEPSVREFLERGAATGVYLDEVRDRTACQVLLDYWVSSLARAAMGAPAARLVPFDGDRLPDLTDKACPYVGLDAFRGREFFFGRESDTQVLLAQVRRSPLTVVLGASGSGKSSLVMAGVLPVLSDPDSEPPLRIVPTVVPGGAALAHLVEGVMQASGAGSQDVAGAVEKLKAGSGDLSALLGGTEAAATLIVIDQFEEVFTLSGAAEREALAAGIAAFLAPERGHRVILTMREEFRARLVELRALSPFLDKAWYSMRPMGYEELKAAVDRPASLVNLQFQSGIVDDLVKKVLGQQAALPLLQFTLRALWEQRDRNRITWEVYRKVGDPLTALETAADEFYDGLAPQTQDEARRILLELVRVDELLEAYRQPLPKSRLLQAGKANTEDVLRLLERNDYLRVTVGASSEDAIVEVKHESLVRNWPRLVSWIDEKRIERRQRIALTQATQRWAQNDKPAEGLLTGWQLEEAKKQPDLSELEYEFVEASAQQVDRAQREREKALRDEAEAERRRSKRTKLWAVLTILVLMAVTVLAVQSRSVMQQLSERADDARRAAERAADAAQDQRQIAEAATDRIRQSLLIRQAALSGDQTRLNELLSKVAQDSTMRFGAIATDLHYQSGGRDIYKFELFPIPETLPSGGDAVAFVTYLADHPTFQNTLLTGGQQRGFRATYTGWGCLRRIVALAEYADPAKSPTVTAFDMCELLGPPWLP